MVTLPPIRPALKSSRIYDRQMPAVLFFWPRMLEVRAASRLARQSARKRLEKGALKTVAAKDDLGGARLSEHAWEGFLTSMNPISSRRRCPGIFHRECSDSQSLFFGSRVIRDWLGASCSSDWGPAQTHYRGTTVPCCSWNRQNGKLQALRVLLAETR